MNDSSLDQYHWRNEGLTEEELRHRIEGIQSHEITLRKHLSRSTYRTYQLSDSFKELHFYRLKIRITRAIYRVPNEIWLEIFSNLVHDDTLESLKNYCTIGLVCQQWHRLIKTRPQPLKVYVIDPAHFPQNPPIDDDECNTFVLILKLSAAEDMEHPCFKKSVERLSSVSDLSLTCHTRLHASVHSQIPSKFPHLRTLKLHIPDHIAADQCRLDLFQNAETVLTSVEIESSIDIHVPFARKNLQRYKEHGMKPLRSVHSMMGSPRLEELSYTICNPSMLAEVTNHKYRSDTLKRFEFNVYNGPAPHVDFLRNIRFPNLESLRVRAEYEDLIVRIGLLLWRSATGSYSQPGALLSLTHLAFHCTPISERRLVRILAYAPNLRSLECDEISNKDVNILSSRPAHKASSCLVPLLDTLILHDATNIRVIEELALSRLNLIVKLLFRDPIQAHRLAVYCGAHIPSPLDTTLRKILHEIEVVIDECENLRNPSCMDGEIATTKRRISYLLDDLERMSWTTPGEMQVGLFRVLKILDNPYYAAMVLAFLDTRFASIDSTGFLPDHRGKHTWRCRAFKTDIG